MSEDLPDAINKAVFKDKCAFMNETPCRNINEKVNCDDIIDFSVHPLSSAEKKKGLISIIENLKVQKTKAVGEYRGSTTGVGA